MTAEPVRLQHAQGIAVPICVLPGNRVLARNDLAVALRDAYPVTPGHTLVIPVRHVGSFFDTTPSEREAMLALLDLAKNQLQAEFSPAGYNIGINDGAAAGQTIDHLHLHLIPRYTGDRPDPRGGVRWVMPDKADYWTRLTCGPDMKTAIEVLDAFENIRRAQRAAFFATQATAHPAGAGPGATRRAEAGRVHRDRRRTETVADRVRPEPCRQVTALPLLALGHGWPWRTVGPERSAQV